MKDWTDYIIPTAVATAPVSEAYIFWPGQEDHFGPFPWFVAEMACRAVRAYYLQGWHVTYAGNPSGIGENPTGSTLDEFFQWCEDDADLWKQQAIERGMQS